MLYTLRNTFLIFALLCSVASLHSCKEEGCTDPNAENYNADADDDDGSCTYARAKFIGTFGAADSCNGGDISPSLVTFVESSATNTVSITNETIGVTVLGTVVGSSFTIDDTFVDDGITFSMVGSGTFSSEDGQDRIDVNYTLTGDFDGQDVSQSCFGVWIKV